MNFGYVRVSTEEQNTERQIAKMTELGIGERNLFVDKASGKNFERRSYGLLRDKLRESDVLFIDSLDRLGRNYDAVKAEWQYLTKEVGCDVVALDLDGVFDSRKFKEQGDIGKFIEDMMLTVLAWVAEQERKKLRERQREGVKIAKREGRYIGRTPIKIDWERFGQEYKLWKDGHITARAAMRNLELKANTFYRRVADFEKNLEEQKGKV